MKKAIRFFAIILLIYINGSTLKAQTIRGDSMPSVRIGTQVWTSENLNVSTFRNGDAISQAKTAGEWTVAGNTESPAWCYYNFDSIYGKKYGKLYNWYAVNDNRGLAPAGWHIPTDKEWATLKNYLGPNEGKKLKSATGWKWDSIKKIDGNGNNVTGFNALAAGCCDDIASFESCEKNASFWSTTEDKKSSKDMHPRANGCGLSNMEFTLYFGTSWMSCGESCRCIKD